MPESTSIPGPSTIGDAPAPSVGQLVSSVTADLSLLVNKEIELAKLELSAAAKKGGIGAGAFLVAAFLGLFIVIFVSFGIAALFALILPTWASYFIVAGIYLLLAAVAGLVGLRKVQAVRKPERTITTAKDTLAWAKHPTTAPATGLRPGTQPVSTPAAQLRPADRTALGRG